MKTIVLIAALALSASSFAAGYETQSFGKYFWASTEAEVVEMIEEAIPSIKAGEDKELTQSMKFQNCDVHPRHIKIGKTFIKKFYRTVDGVLVSKYRGLVTVSNNRCFVSNH